MGSPVSSAPMSDERAGPRSSVEALWLETLGVLCNRVAHELKGALNGVVVNVEVVRSRTAKPDVAAASVRQYAQSASAQLEAVIAMSDAMLSLARPARQPLNLGQAVRNIEALVGAAVRADEKRLELEGMIDALGSTSADADVARLVVASAFIAAVDASPDVVCSAVPAAEGASLCWQCRGGEAVPSIDSAVLSLAASEGIDVQRDGSTLSITFPR